MRKRTQATQKKTSRGPDSRDRDSSGVKVASKVAEAQGMSQPSESLLERGFGQDTFEYHASLLSDSRFSHPANARAKAQIVRKLQSDYGNRYVQRLVDQISATKGDAAQRKLTVGPAGDKFEREADSVAKRVVNMTEPTAQRQGGGPDEEAIQLAPTSHGRIGAEGGDIGPDMERAIHSSRGRGETLPDNLRTSMEGAFGADFSAVRVHTGADADALNDSMSARAFTTGQDMFIRREDYNPGSKSGRELIAHELTHVVQQGHAAETALRDSKSITPGREGVGLAQSMPSRATVEVRRQGEELTEAGAETAQYLTAQWAAEQTEESEEAGKSLWSTLTSLAGKLKPGTSTNPVRLAVEGTLHTAFGITVLAGSVVTSAAGAIPAAVVGTLLGVGQLIVGGLKFVRALFGWRRRGKWKKLLSALIAIEGAVWAFSAALLAVAGSGAAAIMGVIGGAIKIIRGITLGGLALSGVDASKGVWKWITNGMVIAEVLLGGLASFGVAVVKEGAARAAGLIGTLAALVKGSRGAAGLLKVDEATQTQIAADQQDNASEDEE